MKKTIFLLINLLIVLLLFWLGNGMTPTPGSSSGNGNPAILLFIPLCILFIMLTVQWFKIIKDKSIFTKAKVLLLLVLVCHFIAGVYYQVISYRNYRDHLAQVYENHFGDIDWDYIHSITSGLSIHINNQFFNWNTYLLFISLSIFIWLMIHWIKQIMRS